METRGGKRTSRSCHAIPRLLMVLAAFQSLPPEDARVEAPAISGSSVSPVWLHQLLGLVHCKNAVRYWMRAPVKGVVCSVCILRPFSFLLERGTPQERTRNGTAVCEFIPCRLHEDHQKGGADWLNRHCTIAALLHDT